MDDLLSHLLGALEDWRDIVRGNWENRPRLVLNFHRDLRAAWINGLRAFLAVGATGAFWIASAWPFRQPRYLGLRDDKHPADVVRERPG